MLSGKATFLLDAFALKFVTDLQFGRIINVTLYTDLKNGGDSLVDLLKKIRKNQYLNSALLDFLAIFRS